jgi:hypothetical protein
MAAICKSAADVIYRNLLDTFDRTTAFTQGKVAKPKVILPRTRRSIFFSRIQSAAPVARLEIPPG